MSENKTQLAICNLKTVLDNLHKATELPSLDDLQLSGTLKNFELAFELSWKLLRKIADKEGRRITTPREAFRFGLERNLIEDEKLWLSIIEDRNQTVHVYDRASAQIIYQKIKDTYYGAFYSFFTKVSGNA